MHSSKQNIFESEALNGWHFQVTAAIESFHGLVAAHQQALADVERPFYDRIKANPNLCDMDLSAKDNFAPKAGFFVTPAEQPTQPG